MNILKIFDQFLLDQHLSGAPRSFNCETEQAYYDHWHAQGLPQQSPLAQAVAGGLSADRLPWVFAAGYQATLHNAFSGLSSRGWAAFAATEDSENPEQYPGTTLQANGNEQFLNGNKSWLAHSRLVDHLIITINDPNGDKRKARGFIVERDRKGVTITHREQPRFLAAMSQGFVNFKNTIIKGDEIFEFEPIRQFGRTEAKFVMLASCAFLFAHSMQHEPLQDRLLNTAMAIAGLLLEAETSRLAFGAIDREYQQCVEQFESLSLGDEIADYQADKRLLKMYSDRIQRRVKYAQDDAVT